MDCPDLIAEFLQSQKSAQESSGKRKAAESSADGEEGRPKKKKEDVSPHDQSVFTNGISFFSSFPVSQFITFSPEVCTCLLV